MNKSFLILSLAFLAFSCGQTKNDDQPTDSSVTDTTHSASVNNSNGDEPVANLTEPKVFYYDYDNKRGTEDAIVMKKEDAITELNNLPESDGNFFGMELSDGNIVQFMYDGSKKTWFLDIPNPVTQESFDVDVEKADILNIINDCFAGKTADQIKEGYTP